MSSKTLRAVNDPRVGFTIGVCTHFSTGAPPFVVLTPYFHNFFAMKFREFWQPPELTIVVFGFFVLAGANETVIRLFFWDPLIVDEVLCQFLAEFQDWFRPRFPKCLYAY